MKAKYFLLLILILTTSQTEGTSPPHKMIVVGASWSDNMEGNLESTLPLIDLIIRVNPSPGERIFKRFRQLNRHLIDPVSEDHYPFDLDTHALLSSASTRHASWIRYRMPQPSSLDSPPNPAPKYDAIFALDLFFKDLKVFANRYEKNGIDFDTAASTTDLSQADQRTVYAVRAVKKIKDRTHDLLLRFAENAHVAWFGYAATEYEFDDQDKPNPETLTPRQANKWLKMMLANKDPDYPIPSSYANRLFYLDIDSFYHQVEHGGGAHFSFGGNTYFAGRKKILAKGNFLSGYMHLSYDGSRLFANHIMERTLKSVPDWDPYWKPIKIDDDGLRVISSVTEQYIFM